MKPLVLPTTAFLVTAGRRTDPVTINDSADRDETLLDLNATTTLSVCGSMKTLEFLCWLGVDVPRWMENALAHASDTLSESYDQCLATEAELTTFCEGLGMPHGFNVESVSNRKVEIETAVRLAAETSPPTFVVGGPNESNRAAWRKRTLVARPRNCSM